MSEQDALYKIAEMELINTVLWLRSLKFEQRIEQMKNVSPIELNYFRIYYWDKEFEELSAIYNSHEAKVIPFLIENISISELDAWLR